MFDCLPLSISTNFFTGYDRLIKKDPIKGAAINPGLSDRIQQKTDNDYLSKTIKVR
jgi:hypothetical protein